MDERQLAIKLLKKNCTETPFERVIMGQYSISYRELGECLDDMSSPTLLGRLIGQKPKYADWIEDRFIKPLTKHLKEDKEFKAKKEKELGPS